MNIAISVVAQRAVTCLLVCVSLGVNATPATWDAPAVSYIEKIDRAYHWKLWSVDGKTTTTLLRSSAEPKHIFWRPSEHSVYYSLGQRIFRIDLRHRDRWKAVGQLPAGFGDVQWMWVQRSTNRLRVAMLDAVRERDVIRSANKVRYRLKDGKTISAHDLPDWGLPYVATALELQPEGWKVVAQRATKDAAGETPGISMLDKFRQEDGVSNIRILESYTCASGVCRDEVPSHLGNLVQQAYAGSVERDSLGITPGPESRPAAIFSTIQGDSLHMTTPIFLVSQQGRVSELEVGKREQVGLGVNGNWLLLADEGNGSSPIVIDLRNGKIALKSNGNQATWVPREPRNPEQASTP